MSGSWCCIILQFSLQIIANYFTNYIHSLPDHFKAAADRDKLNQHKELPEDMQLVSGVTKVQFANLKPDYHCLLWSTKQCRGDQRKWWLKFSKFLLYRAQQETSLPQNCYKVQFLVSKLSSEKKTCWVNCERFTTCIPEQWEAQCTSQDWKHLGILNVMLKRLNHPLWELS